MRPKYAHTNDQFPLRRNQASEQAAVNPARRAIMLGAGASVLLSACAQSRAVRPPGDLASPQAKVGDLWQYEKFDLYRNEQTDIVHREVTATHPMLELEIRSERHGNLGREVFSKPWSVVVDLSREAPIVFKHPKPQLPAGLIAGDRLTIRTQWRPAKEGPWLFWSEWIDAEHWEKVTVPAGEFVALRMHRTIAYDHPDSFRTDNRLTETLWYAREVNYWVQRESTGTYLLPGMRASAPLREDWVRERLLKYKPAA
jgi:hypothetical protein